MKLKEFLQPIIAGDSQASVMLIDNEDNCSYFEGSAYGAVEYSKEKDLEVLSVDSNCLDELDIPYMKIYTREIKYIADTEKFLANLISRTNSIIGRIKNMTSEELEMEKNKEIKDLYNYLMAIDAVNYYSPSANQILHAAYEKCAYLALCEIEEENK